MGGQQVIFRIYLLGVVVIVIGVFVIVIGVVVIVIGRPTGNISDLPSWCGCYRAIDDRKEKTMHCL